MQRIKNVGIPETRLLTSIVGIAKLMAGKLKRPQRQV